MEALVITEDHRLVVEARPTPRPEPHEVLVRVAGAGLNRADLLQRMGAYPPPPGAPVDIPGMEFAGVVTALGDAARVVAVGDAVFGIVGGGAQAEYLAVHELHCAPVPAGYDLVTAGGVPENFITAHDALRTIAAVQPGERVLIHAVGSGVGTAALRLAKAWGCPTVGTARTPEKLERARELGLDHAVLAERELDPEALAKRIVDEAGPCDVVIDLVGGEYVRADVAAAAPRARIVLIGLIAGSRSGNFPVGAVLAKRLTLVGTTLRGRSVEEKAAATAAFTRDVVPLLAAGTVAPVIEATYPLAKAEDAYARLASDATFGKIVLTP
ncbi:MAG: putative quinone oxidoreductase, family [Actinomycetia bacterium]|nr:putative quinone oxidoreductase, family [Actinomycetes bacterium]